MQNTVATVYVQVDPEDLADGNALSVLVESIAKRLGIAVGVEDSARARDAADQLLLALGIR